MLGKGRGKKGQNERETEEAVSQDLAWSFISNSPWECWVRLQLHRKDFPADGFNLLPQVSANPGATALSQHPLLLASFPLLSPPFLFLPTSSFKTQDNVWNVKCAGASRHHSISVAACFYTNLSKHEH